MTSASKPAPRANDRPQIPLTPVNDLCVALVPIFKGLSHEEQVEVASYSKPIRVAANEQVMQAGSEQRRLLVVHSGKIKLVHILPNGREYLVRTLGTGDVVGEDAFLLGRRPTHFAIAETDAQMCTFDHKDLAGLLAKHPGIALRMLQIQSERLSDAERRLASMSGADVGARLADYLLDQPATTEAGVMTVTFPMAKKDVASYLGMSPETLSRTLRDWVDSGIVATEGRRGIKILDVDRLLELAPE